MILSWVNRFTLKTGWSRGERWSRINFFKLSFSTDGTPKVLYPLKSRTLVKVSGPEAGQFLQGLITNDIKHLEDAGAQSMYAMFLNNRGRVLYDTLVHKWAGENVFMLECDKSIQNLLQKHLKIYKLKRDVQIGDVSRLFNVWALIGPPDLEVSHEQEKLNISLFKDPRLRELGYRLVTSTDVANLDLHNTFGKDIVIKDDEQEYQALKYSLGVSEGAEDLFPGSCFPLEANCDYLHGISFHKGCYIGQELTARIHHTGVVRKRIMPIVFKNISNEEELEKDAAVWAASEPAQIKVGKLKSRVQDVGLGLVRIKEALEAKTLTVGKTPVEIIKPFWWPMEATKERLTIVKPEFEAVDTK